MIAFLFILIIALLVWVLVLAVKSHRYIRALEAENKRLRYWEAINK